VPCRYRSLDVGITAPSSIAVEEDMTAHAHVRFRGKAMSYGINIRMMLKIVLLRAFTYMYG
jgi:hypothetical protein